MFSLRARRFQELEILSAGLQKNAQQSDNLFDFIYFNFKCFKFVVFGSGFRFNEIGSERLLRGKAKTIDKTVPGLYITLNGLIPGCPATRRNILTFLRVQIS